MRSHNRMCMDTFVCCSVHMKTPETLAKRRRKEFFSVWPPPSRVYTFLFYLHITMDAWMWYPHLTAFSLYSRSRLITHELFRRNSIARSVLFFLFLFFCVRFDIFLFYFSRSFSLELFSSCILGSAVFRAVYQHIFPRYAHEIVLRTDS